MIKRKICFVLPFVFLMLLLLMATVYADSNKEDIIILKVGSPNMLVNSIEEEIDENGTVPVLSDGKTLVPIRAIIESMGGSVEWQESESKVIAALNGKEVELQLNSNAAKVNGVEVEIDTAPVVINGRTMLPLRFVSENLGLCVNWEENTQSISITTAGNYVGVVAGEKITEAEFNVFLGQAKQEVLGYLAQGQTGKNPGWDTEINGKKAGEIAKENALYYVKEFKLFLIKARENGIELSGEEIETLENNINQAVGQQGGKDALEKQIKALYNISLPEYIAFCKDYMLVDKYVGEVYKTVNIPEDELRLFYEADKDRIEMVTVKHILVSTLDEEGNTSPEKGEAEKKKAEEILEKVKAGADFAALAKQYSEDPGSKDNGGEYTFSRGEMIKEFEDWSFSAEPGDVGIVKTAYGYHVMKLEKKLGFDELKEDIRQAVAEQKANAFLNALVSDESSVVIKNRQVYDSITIND